MADYIGNREFKVVESKLEQLYQQVDLDAVLGDGTVYNLSQYITEFDIYYNYDESVFPVVKTTMYVDYATHKAISDGIDDCKFRLSIYMVKSTDVDSSTGQQNGIADTFIANKILFANDYDKENQRTTYDEDQVQDIELTLELFLKKHYKLTRKPINSIFSKIKMKNALLKLFSNLKTGGMIITPPDNKDAIKQIVCPSSNIVKTIKYLQNHFGIYKTGYRLWFDFDRGYLVAGDFKYHKPVVEKGEYQNTILYFSKVDAQELKYGSYLDKTNKVYVVVGETSNTFNTNENTFKEVYGEDIVVKQKKQDTKKLSKSKHENKNNIEKNGKSKTNLATSKKKTYYDSTSSDYTVESELALASRNELQYICVLHNINPDYITINKKIYVSFEDSDNDKYDGVYQVSNMMASYEKKNSNLFEVNYNLVLNRISSSTMQEAFK